MSMVSYVIVPVLHNETFADDLFVCWQLSEVERHPSVGEFDTAMARLIAQEPVIQRKRVCEDEDDATSDKQRRLTLRVLESNHASLAYRLTHMESVNRDLLKKMSAMEQTMAKLLPSTNNTMVQDTAVIKINVGGKLFFTRASTLKSVQSSFLANLVSGRFPIALSENNEIFLDRDPVMFEAILNWLRSPIMGISPQLLSQPAFMHELEYFDMKQAVLGDTKVMLFGGQASDQTASSAVYVYYPRLNLWVEEQTKLPDVRRRGGVTLFKNMVYVIGGHNGHRQQNTVFRYDPDLNTWASLAPLTTLRTQAGVVASESFIYAIGGYNLQVTLASMERFCPKTNTWTSQPEMITPRLAHGCVYMAPFIYVVGGWNTTDHFRSVERFDTRAPEKGWQQMAAMLEQRSEVAAVVFNNKIYAIGGYDGQSFLSSVEVYDPVSDSWQKTASMITARAWPAVTVLDNKLFVVGGRISPNLLLNNCEIYDPVMDTWEVSTPIPSARDGHALVAVPV
jgi:N-acetylneuraminic acid mutarotase